MTHYNTFRDQLAIAHPAFGSALWEPDPGEHYPPVEVGDVGFVRQGKFHRLFNALLPANHQSHQRFGVPEHYEPLRLSMPNHIDHGTLNPNNFCSYGVTVESGGSDVFAVAPPTSDSAEFSFSCTRKHGAALSLPVVARREDTLSQAHFGTWITRHIDSWFAFSQRHGLGIEMEDIVLVTGCHRTRSWSNIAFYESQADSRISLRVQVPGIGTTVHWQVLSQRIQGAVLGHCPSGENLPENQCLFIRGFRVKRLFWIIPRLKGVAGPQPDPRGSDHEPEMDSELVSIPSVTECRDPLRVLLEYIATRAPDCDMVLVHDDDLERILRVGNGTSLETLQADVVMDYLKRSKPEIGIMSDSETANNASPRSDMKRMTVAMLSEQLDRLYPPASVPLPSHSLGSTMDTKEMADYVAPSNRPWNLSSSGSVITESGISVDDIVNTVECFGNFDRPSSRSNPEMSSSDSETIASGGTSDIDFDTDVELEGIATDDAPQYTFSLEQRADWDIVDTNKRRQEADSLIFVENVGSDDDDDSDVFETGSRALTLAAIQRSSIAIRVASTRDRSFHAGDTDLEPHSNTRQDDDITTTVRWPSNNDTKGGASVAVTSPNRDQQPPLLPANNAGIPPKDDPGERVYQDKGPDDIVNVNDREGLDKRKSKDKEKGKGEDFDVAMMHGLIGSPSGSQDMVPWTEADNTGLRRPSTVMLDDSFAGGLRRDDSGHVLRRNEWSFIREREHVSLPPRKLNDNPRHCDVWRCSQIGQIRVERATLTPSDPNKPSQQRLNAEHDVDPDSANTLGGPTTIVHRHSRALAFSIYRHYSPRNYRSGGARNSMATVNTRTANSRETRTPVMSTHVTILLSTKRVQGQLTVMKSTTRLARRDTRRESNFSHPRRAPQDPTRSASSLQQEPPTPRHIVDWSGLEELDSQTSNIRGTTPSHIPGSSLDLLGIKTFASSASTSQSVSSTTPHMSPLESSSISERQLSLHDEAEEDSDNKFVNPVSGASHPEAFATFGKRMIEAKRRSHWIQRFIGPPGGSTPRTVASDLDPTNPPWMALVPRSMKKGRSFDNLRLTRSEVGAGVGSKGKGKGKDRDMLSQVPDDSLYMLLPLWPHETDAASAVDEQGQQTPRVQEQNMYLLVYYVPFDERGEDNPAKKPSRSRLQKREQERQIDIRHGFKVIGQLVTHSDLNGSGIRLPVRGLSVTGPLAEAELAIPPASLRDMYPDSFVIGACMDGSGTTIEFFPEGLEKLGLCVPRTEPVRLDIDPAEPVLEQPLTAIGRAAVEVAWLGCMALMTFDGPQSQGPA